MNTILFLNPENVSEADAAAFKRREAARAIVVDADGRIALLHATVYGYYKLPGGGVEDGESYEEALVRECKEEIGCDVVIDAEVGVIRELRNQIQLDQTSYCYLAHVVGEKGTPTLEPGEVAHGMQTVWVAFDEARALVATGGQHGVYEASFMIARDTAFIDAAQQVYADRHP
jgi:8-oxo-dGTP diphosphatase